MWVRAQNRHNLTLCHEINVKGKDVLGKYFQANDYSALLGTYETNRRALEVLNEIQAHVNDYGWSTAHGECSARVFQMPEK